MERRTLTDEERLDWLQLIRSDNVGPVTFHALIARFGTAAHALAALPELARNATGKRAVRLAPRALAERELAALHKYGARLIAAGELDYPEALAALPDAPPLLAVHGRVELLQSPCIGMVGARNASTNGRRFATKLAMDLGAAGLTVVSGLARGLDTAAHEGALGTGTIAVIAGGVDVVYPPENAKLMARIAAEGAVVAEQPFGLKPTARHFPYRNRVISGLSRAIVVVEATHKSGSLITARLAAEQGRDVLAVPGSPLDPRSAGTNGLIRDGAVLVTCAADVLKSLGPLGNKFVLNQSTKTVSSRISLAPDEADAEHEVGGQTAPPNALEMTSASPSNILELLSFMPITIDELTRRSQLSAAAVSSAILELELDGRVERSPGGQISLVISKG